MNQAFNSSAQAKVENNFVTAPKFSALKKSEPFLYPHRTDKVYHKEIKASYDSTKSYLQRVCSSDKIRQE